MNLQYTIEEQEAIIDNLKNENDILKNLLLSIYNNTHIYYCQWKDLHEWRLPDLNKVSPQTFSQIMDIAGTFTEVINMYIISLFESQDFPLVFIDSSDVYIKIKNKYENVLTQSTVLLPFILEEIQRHASIYYKEKLVFNDTEKISTVVLIDSLQLVNNRYILYKRSINSLIAGVIPIHISNVTKQESKTTYKIPILQIRSKSSIPNYLQFMAGISGARCFPGIIN